MHQSLSIMRFPVTHYLQPPNKAQPSHQFDPTSARGTGFGNMKISPHTIRRALSVRGVHLAWCSVLIFVPGRTFAVDCTRDVALLALIHSTGSLSQRERAMAVCVAFIITHVRGANGFGMWGSGEEGKEKGSGVR